MFVKMKKWDVHPQKKIFYSELAYLVGLCILSFGTALMERADFGVSMVVAPAYLLHLKLSQFWPFFTFGMAEYTLQAVILLILSLLMRKVKRSYLFSFVTAVLYGWLLDGMMMLVSWLPLAGFWMRVALYAGGMVCCTCGVALLFFTYISPEAYELFVKELAQKHQIPMHTFKIGYDCASCLLSIVMSFAFFGWGSFEGIKVGTVVCAVFNGVLIGWWMKGLKRCFSFEDRLALRKYFE